MTKAEAKELIMEFTERTGINTHDFKVIDAYLDDPNRTIKLDDDEDYANASDILTGID